MCAHPGYQSTPGAHCQTQQLSNDGQLEGLEKAKSGNDETSVQDTLPFLGPRSPHLSPSLSSGQLYKTGDENQTYARGQRQCLKPRSHRVTMTPTFSTKHSIYGFVYTA